jgi:hypothetical protein
MNVTRSVHHTYYNLNCSACSQCADTNFVQKEQRRSTKRKREKSVSSEVKREQNRDQCSAMLLSFWCSSVLFKDDEMEDVGTSTTTTSTTTTTTTTTRTSSESNEIAQVCCHIFIQKFPAFHCTALMNNNMQTHVMLLQSPQLVPLDEENELIPPDPAEYTCYWAPLTSCGFKRTDGFKNKKHMQSCKKYVRDHSMRGTCWGADGAGGGGSNARRCPVCGELFATAVACEMHCTSFHFNAAMV